MTKTLESYQHKAAKVVVIDWLRCGDGIEPFSVFPAHNRVIDEYPVCKFTPEWRESLYSRDFADWSTDPHGAWDERGFERSPTYNQCLSLKMIPIVIYDIVIIHEGCVNAAIEIVHKHDISPAKFNKLTEIPYIPVYRISAEWVMSQVEKPKIIKFDRVF